MIIISDDQNAIEEFLGASFTIENIKFSSPSNIKIIEKELFQTYDYKFYKSEDLKFWNYLFINKFSHKSQFDTVIQIQNKNVDLPDKLAFLALEGNNFHGFRNRNWSAERGNVHLSIYFKPGKQLSGLLHSGLLLIAAIAVIMTIDSIPGLQGKAKTKWVNDIIIEKSKVCGIITQSFSMGNNITGAVIGIGLNVLNSPKITKDRFTSSAASLNDFTNSEECNLKFVFINLLKNLETTINQLNSGKYIDLLDLYRGRSSVIGKNVEIYTDRIDNKPDLICAGKVIEINNNLELIFENNKIPVRSGRLSFINS